MAEEKSYDDLINELYELREDLGKKKKFATAAKAVEELAKKHGVDFVATEVTTYEEYVTVLDLIVNKVIEDVNQELDKLTQELEQQKAIIQDREAQLESQDGAIQHLKSQNEDYAEQLADSNQKLKEINKKYDELYAVKWSLMEQARYDKRAFAQVVMQARNWKSKYLNTVGQLDKTLATLEQTVEENKTLKRQIQEEREKAGDKIAQANKDIALLKKDRDRYAEEKKTVSKYSSLYGKTLEIIVNAFRAHDYKVLPFSGAAVQEDANRVRAYELYEAVKDAEKADNKAQRRDRKKEAVRYPEAGLNNILDEISAEFDKMIKEMKVADPEAVAKFYKDLGINGDNVPPTKNIIKKIIDRESEKKPFLKTVGGKVFVLAMVAVVLAGVAVPIFIALQNRDGNTNNFEGLDIDGEDIDDEIENEFLENPYTSIPGTLPTNVESIIISPSGMVEIVYNGYDSMEKPIQEVISFQAPAEWLEMGDNLTAEFILDNIPKGAEKQRFENVTVLEPELDDANDAFESESEVDDSQLDDDVEFDDDIETDDDVEVEDVELEDFEKDTIETEKPQTTAPVIDSSAPMVSWNVAQKGNRFVVTGTMLVDGDEVEFTSIGSSVDQCKNDVLSTFWDNGYDVDFELEP